MPPAKRGDSSIPRVLSTILAAILTFVGPTYLIYALQKLGIAYPTPVIIGLACFAAGVAITIYLSRTEGS